MEDYLGWIAGAFITLSLVPQIIRVFKLRSAREISLIFNLLILIGTILWLSYGVMIDRNPIIIWNSCGAILITLLLIAKLRYGMS
jgi:MtN3 and saliva related transmembrane protein